MELNLCLPKSIEGTKLALYLLESIDKVGEDICYEREVYARHNDFMVQLNPTGLSCLWKPIYRFDIKMDKSYDSLPVEIIGFHVQQPGLGRILSNVQNKIEFTHLDTHL